MSSIESGKIKVMQFGSPLRRPGIQAQYLKSLGLGKMNRVKVLIDTPSVRGLLEKLPHMVKILDR